MALGVRSFSNSLLVQNIYNPDNLPDTIPAIKKFAYTILTPTLPCVEVECGTTIGRVLQVPEFDPVGLINLEDNSVITDTDVVDLLRQDITYMRVRDVSNCVSTNGFCSNCGRGFYARIEAPQVPTVGLKYTLSGSPRSFQNYIANTFSGAVMGYSALSAEPIPGIPSDWSSLTNHPSMDRLCTQLAGLGLPQDDLAYLMSVEDILERALLIIGTYGVYGNV